MFYTCDYEFAIVDTFLKIPAINVSHYDGKEVLAIQFDPGFVKIEKNKNNIARIFNYTLMCHSCVHKMAYMAYIQVLKCERKENPILEGFEYQWLQRQATV